MTRRRWIIAVAAVFAVLIPVAITYALFTASAAKAGGVIVNGDLRLTQGASVTWQETTAGIPAAQRRSGTSFSTLAGFVGVPGDTVEVRYPVTSTLVGHNLSAVVRAAVSSTTPTAGVTVSGYRVLDSTGVVIAPSTGYTAMGQTTVVSTLTTPGTVNLSIAVLLTWTGASAPTYTTDLTAGGGGYTITSVPVVISLEQVRTGAGFVP